MCSKELCDEMDDISDVELGAPTTGIGGYRALSKDLESVPEERELLTDGSECPLHVMDRYKPPEPELLPHYAEFLCKSLPMLMVEHSWITATTVMSRLRILPINALPIILRRKRMKRPVTEEDWNFSELGTYTDAAGYPGFEPCYPVDFTTRKHVHNMFVEAEVPESSGSWDTDEAIEHYLEKVRGDSTIVYDVINDFFL